MEDPSDDAKPLRPGREEKIAIAKARKMLSRKPPNHPDRVALEEFLKRKQWRSP